MPVTIRTVIGRVLDPSQQPTLDGEYRFTPTHKLTGTAGDLIPARYVAAPFTAASGGSFSVDLIANDSDDISPPGTTYRVDLFLASKPGRVMDSFNVTVPRAGTGNIELGDLVPVAQAGEVFLYLTQSVADSLYVKPADLASVASIATAAGSAAGSAGSAAAAAASAAAAADTKATNAGSAASTANTAAADAAAAAATADTKATNAGSAAAAAASAAAAADGKATTAGSAATAAASAAAAAAARTSALLLVQAGTPDAMVVGAITRDVNGAATAFNVLWPDGATGVFAGTASSAFPGAIDAYTITHVLAGTTTTTFSQPTVTRNASGAVTNRPAVTVA